LISTKDGNRAVDVAAQFVARCIESYCRVCPDKLEFHRGEARLIEHLTAYVAAAKRGSAREASLHSGEALETLVSAVRRR